MRIQLVTLVIARDGLSHCRERTEGDTNQNLESDIMKTNAERSEASDRYAAALASHYKKKDLRKALELYTIIIKCHPKSAEAEYSRSQIRNIATNIVPEQELFDAQVGLVLTHLDGDKSFSEHNDTMNIRQQRKDDDIEWEKVKGNRRDAEKQRRTNERTKSPR